MSEEENILDSLLIETNYWENFEKLEEFGFNKILIKKLYIYLNPNSLENAITLLSKKNNLYQHDFYENKDNNKCLICNEEGKNHINYDEIILEANFDNQLEISKETENLLLKNGNLGTCKIITKKLKGTGFFCKIPFSNNTLLKVLMTNNHVIPKEELIIGNKIKLSYKNSLKYIEITGNRFFKTSVLLDYTCIEILDEDQIEFFYEIEPCFYDIKKIATTNVSSLFLYIKESINHLVNKNKNEEKKLFEKSDYINDEIAIVQYPKGGILKVKAGHLLSIDKYNITHNVSTFQGSSGSPILLLLRDYKVIGIHKAYNESKKINMGTFINNIIEHINLNEVLIEFTIKEENLGNPIVIVQDQLRNI